MIVAHLLKTTGLSGAEAHVLALAQGLRAEGVQSRVLVLADPRMRPTELIAEAQSQSVSLDLTPLLHDADVTVIPRIAAWLKSTGAQLVHTHMIHGDLYGALTAGRRAVVQTRHNDDRFRRNPAVQVLTRRLASRAKTVIAISDAVAAFVRDVEGVPAAKIVRIHYGLDPEAVTARAVPGALRSELGLGSGVPLVGAVGRLTTQKGYGWLLEAMAQLPEAHLALAGDGELRPALQAQCVALGLANRVHFLGWRSDASTVLADLDVLAVPSLWEGFGLVTLEAMALGKPIVASRVSALPEIVSHGETGLLVPPSDPAALADALRTVLINPARARTMGGRGRARLEKEFTVQRMARRHAEVYREAASRVPEFRA